MTELKPFAFVLMPFDKAFDDVYHYGIKQCCNEVGIVAERVDEQFYSESMLERIYRQIDNADLIIADMSGRNPNVFYEVGYAHAKTKNCALLTQKKEDIPFDLQHHFHIIYDGKIGTLKEQLLPRLQWMKAEHQKRKSEVLTVSLKAQDPRLEVGEYFHKGEFVAKVTIKNNSSIRSPEIDHIALTATDKWTAYSNAKECAFEAPSKGRRKFYVQPANSRIAPGAISLTEVTLKRQFWSKWTGEEKKEEYRASGRMEVEIATAEGSLPFNFDLDIEFSEFPF